ncbi:MAG: hypothetical protein ABI680_09045 [Chthoniobacteraceae bacterium]
MRALTQVLHDEARFLHGLERRVRMAKPKALRELPHERHRRKAVSALA